jgi:hypothetical protein
MIRRRRTLLGIVTALAVLVASWATGMTLGAFSDLTQNPGNTFSAASSFCASPGRQTLSSDADAYLDEQRPTNNYGTATSLSVRSGGGGRNQRALMRFPLPAAQYCTVTSATLRLYAGSATSGRTLEVQRGAAAWTEAGVTWANQPASTGAASTAPSGTGWVQFDVTAEVQGMYAGANDGFLVSDTVEGQNPASTQRFNSREAASYQPELVITLG